MCEHEVGSLDLAINVKKSVCTRIGSRCMFHTAIFPQKLHGVSLQWVDTVRYVGVHIICTRRYTFNCSIDYAKQSFIEHSIHFMVR